MDLSNGSLRRLAIAIMTKEFEIIEIEVKEGVALDFGIKDIMLPNVILLGGGVEELLILQCCDNISRFYMGHLPMKTKFNVNIGCVMSLKWSHVR